MKTIYNYSTSTYMTSLLLLSGAMAAGIPDIESIDVRILNPEGAKISAITAANSWFYAGLADAPGSHPIHAFLWSRDDLSLFDLHPNGYHHADGPATKSQIRGMDESQQVGHTSATRSHAALWSGDAGSHVDLHPSGALYSYALAVENGRQAGSVAYGSRSQQAAMWSSTPESLIILNPPQAKRSNIQTMSEGWQGGWTESGRWRAAAWQGTVESFVDLNPDGWQSSWIIGNRGAEMVGWVSNGGSDGNRAARWSGTKESYQSLHPVDALWSSATATDGEFQVGVADFGSEGRALLWRGDPDSFVNLHEVLDSTIYVRSTPRAIRREGLRLIVVGNAQLYGWPYSKSAIEWVITLADHEAPVIIGAIPVGAEVQPQHGHDFDVKLDVSIEDNSGGAEWYIESVRAGSSRPGKRFGALKSAIRVVDGTTLRVRREPGKVKSNLTYTVVLRAVDPSGNVSEAHQFSFVLNAP